MRLDRDTGESRRLRTNSSNNSKKVEVWMSAPGVGVRPCRLGLLGPCGEPKGKHFAPGLQEVQILISHTGMIQRTRQIETEVIGRLRHFQDRARGRKTRIGSREDFA